METSELTKAQWERLRPPLPPRKPQTGRPANDHRTVINGILWVLRTGQPVVLPSGAQRLLEDGLQPLLPVATGRQM